MTVLTICKTFFLPDSFAKKLNCWSRSHKSYPNFSTEKKKTTSLFSVRCCNLVFIFVTVFFRLSEFTSMKDRVSTANPDISWTYFPAPVLIVYVNLISRKQKTNEQTKQFWSALLSLDMDLWAVSSHSPPFFCLPIALLLFFRPVTISFSGNPIVRFSQESNKIYS